MVKTWNDVAPDKKFITRGECKENLDEWRIEPAWRYETSVLFFAKENEGVFIDFAKVPKEELDDLIQILCRARWRGNSR